MKKLVSYALTILLLITGAVFALPYLISTDTMRQEFASKISSASGMDIALDGPVSFSVFPEFGLVAQDVKLVSPEGDFLASVTEFVSGVKLSSVLSGKIEITRLSLDRPKITFLETANTAENNLNGIANSDPFAAAVEQLERLSLNSLSMTGGTIIMQSLDGSSSSITNINAELKAPDLDGEVNLELSAVKDGQNISLSASLAALRPILQRKPSKVEVALKLDPAPHPALSDLTASGRVLLADDGSYQILQGLLTSLDQPLQLDVLYRPGERPYAAINLQAKRVDLGLTQGKPESKAETSGRVREDNRADDAIADLQFLAGIDADVNVRIDDFQMDNTQMRGIDLALTLKNGALDLSLGNAAIASGAIAAVLSANLDQPNPIFKGRLEASALEITDLARLANMDPPMTGGLGLAINYTFRGLSAEKIKNSFNMAGTARLSNGSVIVPVLEGFGQSTDIVSDINMYAEIHDVQKPIDLDGQMFWNGEAIGFETRLKPHSFINNNAGSLSLALNSRKFSGNYSGEIDLNGSAAGNLKLSTESLGILMAWVGLGEDPQLKGFSYDGGLKADTKKIAFDKAQFTLNDMRAAGSGSIIISGKPEIITNVSIDALNITDLIGGTGSANSQNDSGSKDTPIDLSVLKSFDADIKIGAKKVSYGKVKTGPLVASLIVKDGIAQVHLPKTSFYDGSVLADITADGSGEKSTISFGADLSDVSALKLFGDAADFKRIEGKLNARLKIDGAGNTTRQFASSLNGAASAKFANGAIRGIGIAKIYNNLTTVLAGGFKENQNDKTAFTELGLSFDIKQGVATTSDIKLLGPLVRMSGAGSVDLAQENIDMRLHPLVVMSTTGQGGAFDLDGFGVPIIIKGALSKPKIYPDLRELLKNPQAALDVISKFGTSAGKIGMNPVGKVENLVGNLIGKKDLGGGTIGTVGEKNIVGALLNKLLKPNALQPADTTQIMPQSNDQSQSPNDIDVIYTGSIPIPTPNPRRQGSGDNPEPKSVDQQIVDQVVPKLNLPIDQETAKKSINGLLDGLLR